MRNKSFKLIYSILKMIICIIIYIFIFKVFSKVLPNTSFDNPEIIISILFILPFLFITFGLLIESLITVYLIYIYPNKNYRLEKITNFISQKYYSIVGFSYIAIFIIVFIYIYVILKNGY